MSTGLIRAADTYSAGYVSAAREIGHAYTGGAAATTTKALGRIPTLPRTHLAKGPSRVDDEPLPPGRGAHGCWIGTSPWLAKLSRAGRGGEAGMNSRKPLAVGRGGELRMGFENDPAIQAAVKKMERAEDVERSAVEKAARQVERVKARRAIRRELKNKILVYLALAFTCVLVWQKINIVILIPASFTHLALIFGGLFLLVFTVLNTLFRSDD